MLQTISILLPLWLCVSTARAEFETITPHWREEARKEKLTEPEIEQLDRDRLLIVGIEKEVARRMLNGAT